MTTDFSKLKKSLIDRISPLSVGKSKKWWENYVKHGTLFRGVGIPVIRENLKAWYKEEGIGELPPADQLELAISFFHEEYSEDKIAGILLLQLYLYEKIEYGLLLSRFEKLFDEELIFDWNVCDWLCVRVLGPMIEHYGKGCVEIITSWRHSDYVWQARCSLVAFANLAESGEYTERLLETCSLLIKREERFAKTAVGWILRELSKIDREIVRRFISAKGEHFTRECLDNSLKYFDKDEKKRIISSIK